MVKAFQPNSYIKLKSALGGDGWFTPADRISQADGPAKSVLLRKLDFEGAETERFIDANGRFVAGFF
jgi:hypothetical protein